MPIAICGVHEVPQYADTPLDHIISIRERHQPGPDITGFKHPMTLHSFVFGDVGQLTEFDPPTETIMRRLFDIFARTTLEDRMLFHCFAGASRSTAAAFLWLVHRGVGYEQAYDTLLQVRPFINTEGKSIVRPNPLMISLGDKVMGRGGKMLRYVCERKDDMGYLESAGGKLVYQ